MRLGLKGYLWVASPITGGAILNYLSFFMLTLCVKINWAPNPKWQSYLVSYAMNILWWHTSWPFWPNNDKYVRPACTFRVWKALLHSIHTAFEQYMLMVFLKMLSQMRYSIYHSLYIWYDLKLVKCWWRITFCKMSLICSGYICLWHFGA